MENWEIIADTPEKLEKKCKNPKCRVFCDISNRIICDKCNKTYCLRCRLYESHSCNIFKSQIENRNSKTSNILFEDYRILEKGSVNSLRKVT